MYQHVRTHVFDFTLLYFYMLLIIKRVVYVDFDVIKSSLSLSSVEKLSTTVELLINYMRIYSIGFV